MAKKEKKIKEERLEDILWACREHLRGKADMSDKRDVLLTLVFLKFMSDRFVEQQEKIRAKYADPKLAEIQMKKPAAYGQDGVIFLPEECRWRYLVDQVDANKKALALDAATALLDKQEEKLRNALPQGLFVSCDFEPKVLKSVMEELDKIDAARFGEKDMIGRVYEYYLQAFSINADKEEGEFYTPKSLVELIATMIEPFDGTLYDPCCGAGGMFIQCAKLVESKGGNTKTINVYGQESEPATYRLAKMNLAVRGISYHLGDKAISTFTKDQHPDLKVDYIMANPPFNLKKWRTEEELLKDPRWDGYEVPPVSNANYAWILHILSKLNPADGVAGFLLANGALDDADTLAIRKKLIENDKVEAIVVLPREMFYSTDISVTLWILNQNKRGGIWHGRQLRDRTNEVLFIDLRTWNQEIYEKKFVRLTTEQIAAAAKIYHDWQGGTRSVASARYAQPELYRSVFTDEIAANNYSLVPSRYIEFVDRDTELDYETALKDVSAKTRDLLARQRENAKRLEAAFKTLGMIL